MTQTDDQGNSLFPAAQPIQAKKPDRNIKQKRGITRQIEGAITTQAQIKGVS